MKKKPQRTCIVCKGEADKRTLLRIVKNPIGEISVDLSGKKSGRGAYVCKDEKCFSLLKKGKYLNRAFKVEVAGEVYDELLKEFYSIER